VIPLHGETTSISAAYITLQYHPDQMPRHTRPASSPMIPEYRQR